MTTESGELSPPQETATATEPAQPPRPRRRLPRWVLPALSTLLVLGVTGGGIAYTADRVETADRTAPTTYWRGFSEDTSTATHSGRAHTGVGKLLLPMPDTYQPGPDIEEFGNDTELTGKQAVELLKQSTRGLPGPVKRELVKMIGKQKIEGQAMRSYASSGFDLVVEIQLTKMSRKAAKDSATFQKKLTDALTKDLMRRGPKVPGYKDAVCSLLPKDAVDGQDLMACTAVKGAIEVSLTAYGPRSIDQKAVAKLLREQLDRITDGESA